MSPRRLSDRRRPPLRLGLAVAGGVERAGPLAGQARHQLPSFGAGQEAGVELVLPSVIEPTFELSQLGPRLGEIHDAALAKAGFGLDPLVHALPQPQALDDQRDFAGVAAHFAAPAPITAGLFAGDMPLLAQRHRDPLFREKQGRAGADDAAADDYNISARR